MPGSEVSTKFRYGVQPSGCAESEQANQHIRCGVFFGVLEVRQRFEQVNAVVTQIGELFLEKLKKVTQPVTRCGNVEVDEIPFCAPARDCADLHTSNVSRIGYGDLQDMGKWEQDRVGIAQETDLGRADTRVKGLAALAISEKPLRRLRRPSSISSSKASALKRSRSADLLCPRWSARAVSPDR